MKPYRVAIIGCGSVAGNHIRALHAAGRRVEVVAAVDMIEDRVKSFCEEYQVPHSYTNSTDMLLAIQPDLVHIATPTAMHFARLCTWQFCINGLRRQKLSKPIRVFGHRDILKTSKKSAQEFEFSEAQIKKQSLRCAKSSTGGIRYGIL